MTTSTQPHHIKPVLLGVASMMMRLGRCSTALGARTTYQFPDFNCVVDSIPRSDTVLVPTSIGSVCLPAVLAYPVGILYPPLTFTFSGFGSLVPLAVVLGSFLAMLLFVLLIRPLFAEADFFRVAFGPLAHISGVPHSSLGLIHSVSLSHLGRLNKVRVA